MIIRSANIGDGEEISKIYSHYVENTAITFETVSPTGEEFEKRIEEVLLAGYPYTVTEEDGEILGYAYAVRLGKREAYFPSAEASVYVKRDVRNRGIGKLLYGELEKELKKRNITNLYACITCATEENDPYVTDASVRFHHKMGYNEVGHFNSCGEKFGRRYSVKWMEKIL